MLAVDGEIKMDELSNLIGLAQFRKSPLELLTLSACETAIGDDRAALGLAGVAIQAGAKSAVATLWSVDDKATSDLVVEFYRQLRDASLSKAAVPQDAPPSKAAALQGAQLKILSGPAMNIPSFGPRFCSSIIGSEKAK